MYGKSDDSPQWTVHAEFTISHDGVNEPTVPQAHVEREGNGVRMTYTWTTQPPTEQWATHSNHPSTSTGRTSKTTPDLGKPTSAFQRGNLLFSSTPPRRTRNPSESSTATTALRNRGVQDSGYSSELLSPNSYINATLPRRPPQPYNRKCKSTCSIVLSTAFKENPGDTQHSQCGRTQSLRCQTPTLRCEPKESKFYGCGDPWCYHSNYGDTRISPLPETTEDGSEKMSSTISSCSTVRAKSSPPSQKDVSVQTAEMVDKSTSPYLRTDSFQYKGEEKKQEKPKRERSLHKRSSYSGRSRVEPAYQRTHSPSSFTPDSLESQQVLHKCFNCFHVLIFIFCIDF